MGGAAFFGLAIMSGSKLVGTLAIISVLSHFWFLSRVEKWVLAASSLAHARILILSLYSPHMRRLYGDSLRQDAGVTKTFKGVASKNAHRAPPKVAKAVQEFQGTLERVYDDTAMAVEEFLKKCKPYETTRYHRRDLLTPTFAVISRPPLEWVCRKHQGLASRVW